MLLNRFESGGRTMRVTPIRPRGPPPPIRVIAQIHRTFCLMKNHGARNEVFNRGARPIIELSSSSVLDPPCDTLLQFCQNLINCKAGSLLARGEFLERRYEPAHEMLRRHEKINMIEYPVPVGVRGDGC